MKRVFLSVALGLLSACASGSPPAPAPTPTTKTTPPPVTTAEPVAAKDAGTEPHVSEPVATPSDGNAFTLKLYGEAARTPGNMMLSGTSLRVALAAALLGARGDTAAEMASVLDLPRDPAAVADAIRNERAGWDGAKSKEFGADLVVATDLWSEKAATLEPTFLELADKAFGAKTEPMDFSHSADAARKTINAKIASLTANKITDLLAPGSVDARTRMVVTNAVYFRGRWVDAFAKDATKNEPFHLDAKKTSNVPMMHATAAHRFAELPNANVVEMEYAGTSVRMLVLVPREPTTLASLEGDLGKTLDGLSEKLSRQRVAITMPRFTFKWGGSMNARLSALGMKTAFGSKADFSGVSKQEPLQLSEVTARTWVSVDEIGTEAAAASAAVMRATSMVTGPAAELKADRPFLFVIRDEKTKRILFAGRVTAP